MAQWRALLDAPVVPLDEGALVIAAHASARPRGNDLGNADPMGRDDTPRMGRDDITQMGRYDTAPEMGQYDTAPEMGRYDIAAQMGRLDDLASEVRVPTADGVCRLLFADLGLRGNASDYDDPRNSFLDQVLDRRLGIPISLSVLLIEVGRRCGVELEGIGMPGHFLVRDRDRPDALIDAFGAGRRLDRDACRALLGRVTGTRLDFDPALSRPAAPVAILARMLANLDRCYRSRGDASSLLCVSRLRGAVPGRSVAEQTELAGQLADLGAMGDAADLLEGLAADPRLPEEAVDRLRQRALSLRALLN